MLDAYRQSRTNIGGGKYSGPVGLERIRIIDLCDEGTDRTSNSDNQLGLGRVNRLALSYMAARSEE